MSPASKRSSEAVLAELMKALEGSESVLSYLVETQIPLDEMHTQAREVLDEVNAALAKAKAYPSGEWVPQEGC